MLYYVLFFVCFLWLFATEEREKPPLVEHGEVGERSEPGGDKMLMGDIPSASILSAAPLGTQGEPFGAGRIGSPVFYVSVRFIVRMMLYPLIANRKGVS